jgi:hypothetical protein
MEVAQRKASLYCSDLAEALSLLIDACEEEPAFREATEEDDEPQQNAFVTGGYSTGGRGPRIVVRSSDLSQWSRSSDSSFASADTADSSDSFESTSSSISSRSSTAESSSNLWRRYQVRQQARTVLCEPGVKPTKEVRIKGTIYVIGGERKKWDGRQWRLVCCVDGCTAATRSTTNFCIAHGRCHGLELQ